MNERATAAGIVGILGGGLSRAINNRQNARNILDAARIQGEYGIVRTQIDHQYAAEAQQREHENLLNVTRENNSARLTELGIIQPHQLDMQKLANEHELNKLKTESELRTAEGSAKTADEMRLTVIKGQEERKTTSTAVMQENQRLKNLRAAGVNVDSISELGTKSGTTDLRLRKYKPEEESSGDFSEAPAPTPGTGAKSRGATLNEHFGADTGITPAGSARPAPAAPAVSVAPVSSTTTTAPAPSTPTIPTLSPTSTPSIAVTETGQEDTARNSTSEEQYTTGEHETDLEKIKSRFKIKTNDFGHKWGTYKDPTSKLEIELHPNYQRPQSRWKDKYGQYWQDRFEDGKPEENPRYGYSVKAPELKLQNGGYIPKVDGGATNYHANDGFESNLHEAATYIAGHNSHVNQMASVTKEERDSKIAAKTAYDQSKIGKPCTFCGEHIDSVFDANSHQTLDNGWCGHAWDAVTGYGNFDTDKDK